MTATQGKAMAQGGTARLGSRGKQLLLPWPGRLSCSLRGHLALITAGELGTAWLLLPAVPLCPCDFQAGRTCSAQPFLMPSVPTPRNTWRKSWRPHSCQHSLQQCFQPIKPALIPKSNQSSAAGVRGGLCQEPAATLRRWQGRDETTLLPQSHPTAKKGTLQAKQHFQETFQTL